MFQIRNTEGRAARQNRRNKAQEAQGIGPALPWLWRQGGGMKNGMASSNLQTMLANHKGGHVTLELEGIRCGRAGCSKCPHGPYWYAYFREGGKLRSRYIGKDEAKARAFAEAVNRRGRPFGAKAGHAIGLVLHRIIKRFRGRNGNTRNPKELIPAPIRWAVWQRDNFTCRHCGARSHLAVDHIIPESKGGPTEEDNLQTLCKRCNSRKGNRISGEENHTTAPLPAR